MKWTVVLEDLDRGISSRILWNWQRFHCLIVTISFWALILYTIQKVASPARIARFIRFPLGNCQLLKHNKTRMSNAIIKKYYKYQCHKPPIRTYMLVEIPPMLHAVKALLPLLHAWLPWPLLQQPQQPHDLPVRRRAGTYPQGAAGGEGQHVAAQGPGEVPRSEQNGEESRVFQQPKIKIYYMIT